MAHHSPIDATVSAEISAPGDFDDSEEFDAVVLATNPQAEPVSRYPPSPVADIEITQSSERHANNDAHTLYQDQSVELYKDTLNRLLQQHRLLSASIKRLRESNTATPNTIDPFQNSSLDDIAATDKFMMPAELPYSVRPIFEEFDPLLGMFHSLKFSRDINSFRASVETQEYSFSGSSVYYDTATLKSTIMFKFDCNLKVRASDYSVSDFIIDLTSSARRILNRFLSRCREEKDISKALYGLSTYSEVVLKRFEIFTTLARKYNVSKSQTSWPVGNVIAFRPSQVRFPLLITWAIVLGPNDDEASSDFTAYHPECPDLTEVFIPLIKDIGVSNAICSLHDILYK